MENRTQKQDVIQFLKKHKKISTMEASHKLLIAHLQSVIRDIKKEMDVGFEWVYKKNIYGRPVRFKRYFLINLEEEQKCFLERIRRWM